MLHSAVIVITIASILLIVSKQLFITFYDVKHVLVYCTLDEMELDERNIEIIHGDGPFNPFDIYTYECKPGYKKTTNTVTCGVDGTWSAQPDCATSE